MKKGKKDEPVHPVFAAVFAEVLALQEMSKRLNAQMQLCADDAGEPRPELAHLYHLTRRVRDLVYAAEIDAKEIIKKGPKSLGL